MNPKISIIIPMYNVEKYLRRCLDSVKNQTFTDWQAICVDDGSPDKSGEIAEEYASKDKRFIVVHKENGGVSEARNMALSMVDGEYVMFLDSDDCIHPQTMEILYNVAKKSDVDVVTFEYDRDAYADENAMNFPCDKMPDMFNHKYDVNNIKYKRVKNLITKSTNDDYGIKSWYVQNGMIWMRMYRKSIVKNIRFNSKLKVFEDTLFWSEVLLQKPSGAITRLPLYYYSVNQTSVLHSGMGQSYVDTLQCFGETAKRFLLCGKKSDAKIWFKRFFYSILSRIYHSAKRAHEKEDIQKYVYAFKQLHENGVLDYAPGFHAHRYRRRILDFIARNS